MYSRLLHLAYMRDEPAVRGMRAARTRARASVLLALVGVLAQASAQGFETLRFDVGRVTRNDWIAHDVSLALELGDTGMASITVAADRVQHASWPRPIERVRLRCARAVSDATSLRCADASLRFIAGGREFTGSGADLALEHGGESGRLRAERLAFAGGSLTLEVVSGPREWHAELTAQRLELARVFDLGSAFAPLPAVQITQGRGNLRARVSGAQRVQRVAADVRLDALAFSDQAGLRAGTGLDLAATLSLDALGEGWRMEGRAAVTAGELYVDPVYVAVPGAPLALAWRGQRRGDAAEWEVERLSAVHPGVARVSGDARIGPGRALERLALRLERTALAPLYATYLQPFVTGTPLDRLRTRGELEATMNWSAPDGARATVTLSQVHLADEGERFGLAGLDGELHWAQRREPDPSELRWDGGHLYRIELGPARMIGRLRGHGLSLVRPLVQPVFDGSLRLERFEAEGLGGTGVSWRLGGRLEPVSLERLTPALGWPPLGGSISGQMPSVRYERGALEVDAPLVVHVFDGTVTLRDLRLRRPLGIAPVLHAEVDVRAISLDALTRTFSFGKIQGRLDGSIRDLVLEDWKLRAFDAHFATPKDDPSPHRISQRAIENLTRLGGAQAAISATFLRFFEEFSYERLGMSCRLAGGVCEMGGVEDAERGYYIVKGGGMPRIDVMGYNRRVDWNTLLERLERITGAEGALMR